MSHFDADGVYKIISLLEKSFLELNESRALLANSPEDEHGHKIETAIKYVDQNGQNVNKIEMAMEHFNEKRKELGKYIIKRENGQLHILLGCPCYSGKEFEDGLFTVIAFLKMLFTSQEIIAYRNWGIRKIRSFPINLTNQKLEFIDPKYADFSSCTPYNHKGIGFYWKQYSWETSILLGKAAKAWDLRDINTSQFQEKARKILGV